MPQLIRDLMTRDIRTLTPDATAVDAARTMRDHDIGDVLVVGDDGSLMGVVTDRDIVVRALAEGRDPGTVTLREVSTGDLVTVSPDADVKEAVRLMSQHAVRRLPVVEGRKPVGVVSLGDLAIERDSDSALADISAAPENN